MQKIVFGNGLPGYIAGAVGKQGVVVLQEWWGITDEIKLQATKISEHGYRVLIPDLYKGKLGVDAEEASHLMGNLDWKNALAEISEAVEHLKTEGSQTVGTIGFCMGGALSLLAAEHTTAAACIGFYGVPDSALSQPEKITVPVETHVGAEDNIMGFSDLKSVKAWTDKVNGGVCHVYPAEGHGFMNVTESAKKLMKSGGIPLDSKDETRKLAWSRVFDFFKKNL